MHKIVTGVGTLIAVVGLIIMVYGASQLVDKNPVGTPAALIGMGVLLSGSMLYCFGAIVEHLIALRRISEKQLAIFEQRAAARPVAAKREPTFG
ncbi:hypothetical protein JYU29_05975 [Tianweitania sp. BSSL-BM11]|uniref:Uncharacterized protein n=1 Tax=Tianweitania aestuarii TaxID=2814886 RepID=A0ABS5RTE7_9HYPH|nr:hypothetical protein [Tianweitania aestuarii]MBS9720232.1 hypothetical protein [Tianweitania aestuarii]